MSQVLLKNFLCLSLLFSSLISAGGELSVVTCFFTGKWAPGGFAKFEKKLKKSQSLTQKYDKINTIDICLGSGSKKEELKNGWTVLETIKESFDNSLGIQNLVKTYPSKKPKVALVLSSLAGVLVRCAIQKYGPDLPFLPTQLISICAPQTGIFSVPPDGNYTNPVEKACSAVQKFTTDNIMNTLPLGSLLAKPASIFGWFTGPSYMASVAHTTLYREIVQENWISLWRDPYHLKDYQVCRAKKNPPFLPIFNNELDTQDTETYEQELKLFQKNIGLVDYFDFIASKNDQFILPETALCQEEEVVNKVKKYREKDLFLKRIGVDPKRAQFHAIASANHECHTNPAIIKETIACLENRW